MVYFQNGNTLNWIKNLLNVKSFNKKVEKYLILLKK